jgi:hypothetical protein
MESYVELPPVPELVGGAGSACLAALTAGPRSVIPDGRDVAEHAA